MTEEDKAVLKRILSKQAIERLGRVRVVKPELATQLEMYLVQLYQAGKIKGEVTEEQLKTILETVSAHREFKIIK
jgi:programmed cell death protein 5